MQRNLAPNPRSFSLRHLLGAALVGSAVLAAPVALAQPSPQAIKEASRAYEAGEKAAANGQHGTAAAHFERAHRAAPSAPALGRALESRDRAGQLARAATLAQEALKRFPNNAKLKALAEDVMKRAEGKFHQLSVKCKPACILSADQRLVHAGAELTSAQVFLKPGTHTLAGGWGDKASTSREVRAKAGGKSKLILKRPEPEAAPPVAPVPAKGDAEKQAPGEQEPDKPKEEASGGLPPVVFIGGAIVTGALAGAFIWSYTDAKSSPGEDRVRAECKGLGESCPAYQEGLDGQSRTNLLLGGAIGAGVLTVAIGAFFTDWGGDAPAEKAPAARLVPTFGPGGQTGLAAVGRF